MNKKKILFSAALLGGVAATIHKHQKNETVTNQLIPRHWDQAEIQHRFQLFTDTLAEGTEEELGSFFVGKSKKDFEKLRRKQLTWLETQFLTMYKVKGDSFNNLRGLISYRVATTKKEYTFVLQVARLGDSKGVGWYIQKMISQDYGIRFLKQNYLQLTPLKPQEELCLIETNAGDITLRLFPQAAPKAVKNWRELARQGFYDNTIFARVIKDFVIQGGALDGSGQEAESIYGGYFEDELDEGLYHFDGAVCLGNHGPNTNGNQFYIVQRSWVDQEQLHRMSLPQQIRSHYEAVGGIPELDGRYTVFGQVIEGLTVLRQIANRPTNQQDAPRQSIKIKQISFKKGRQS
ncbi:MAG: peptidylprolyl isomerase [Enterococcus devriesei]|uniref:peptidylprolyl isomerase n=1 Tax=Enterococcus devriesei TaxID=319970 RepID=UPI003F90CC09